MGRYTPGCAVLAWLSGGSRIHEGERGGGREGGRGEGRVYVTDLWGATLQDVLFLHGSQEVPGYTREREGEGERGGGGRGECMSLTCGALHS